MAPRRTLPIEPHGSVLAAQEGITELAAAWDVAIYPIDPSRFADVRGFRFSAGTTGSAAAVLRRSVYAALDAVADPLAAMAEDTGGVAYLRTSDLGAVFAQIEQDNGRFYVLLFEPAQRRNDGSRREIRVEVPGQDVIVRARGAFLDGG